MEIEWADRIKTLPPYLFAEIDKKKQQLIEKGIDVIDLGVGDPDIPTPTRIIEALHKSSLKSENHRYPSYTGLLSFRNEVASWYKKRFNVDVAGNKNVLILIGSKEGVAHAPLAFINPGDIALVPDPGYPVYGIATTFAGGIPYQMPLLESNGFLPDLDLIPANILEKTKLMFLNYPNNPTTAFATDDFFKKAIDLAYKHKILICHDAAYTEVYFADKPKSFLEYDGAMEVGIEFHSLSKTFSMTGWRLAHVVGNEKAIAGIGKIKTNIDSGAFQAIQEAGIEALRNYEVGLEDRVAIYKKRCELLSAGLESIGIEVYKPKGTFYVWFKNPQGLSSSEFANILLEDAGIVMTPGTGFGEYGEGYTRASVTIDDKKLYEAVERIKNLSI
ncbi:MAG TPA: aminotransferase class I/II-fold pyridoxal phosphate-dependent enzyme [Candidatus Dadabacteria bacterium]|nr:aminotransferase class I/II-fold pyridoxal phosphate-dependent enzyme [Candidatus Dadabacteria bacterium]